MGLSHELISQFAKVVNANKKQSAETIVYGTVQSDGNGNKYVKLDGSDQLTPLTDENQPSVDTSSAKIHEGDRVSVLIKNHTATVTGNISSPAVSDDDVETSIQKFDIAIGEQIQANKAYFKELTADKANLGSLVAAIISVTELIAKDAKIEELVANKITVDDLVAKKIDTDVVTANYATIESLKATDAKIGSLDADIADINTLMFGSATGDTLQTTFANAVIALLGDAQIKSAMIASLDASKLNAGTVNTNNIKIESEDGRLVIVGNTIQIKDENNTVRVQIGRDASGDYSINVWDTEGNLMFSEGGITDKAIKEAIIRDDMVSDTANINAKKLDISSLFTEINGSSETIKSTKIYFDSQKQTLDMAFDELNTTVTEQGETIESQGTDISVIQGKINSKVWQQDINEAAAEQNTKYSELQQNLNGFKAEVKETYSTKDDLSNLEIGGRNLLRFTGNLPLTYSLESGISSYGTAKPLTATDDGIRFDVPDTGEGGINIPLISDGVIQNRETVTISFDYRGNMTDLGAFYFLQRTYPNVSVNTFPDTVISEEEWQHYEYTFSSNYANDRICYSVLLFYMPAEAAGKWIEIKKGSLKMERGYKATDWTPASEDMASSDDIKNTADTINKTISEHVATINSNADAISLSVSSLEASTNEKLNDITDNIESLRKDVELKVSDESVDIKIQSALNDGTKKVDTGTGIKFDESGMNVNKIDHEGNPVGETNTQITENGMTVNSNTTGDPVLKANKDGVDAENLRATTYLIVGDMSRFQSGYKGNRTACFWIGE